MGIFCQEIRYSFYYPYPCKDSLRSHGDSQKSTVRSGEWIAYHLNLLKPWREMIPVVLVTVLPKREELGLEEGAA